LLQTVSPLTRRSILQQKHPQKIHFVDFGERNLFEKVFRLFGSKFVRKSISIIWIEICSKKYFDYLDRILFEKVFRFLHWLLHAGIYIYEETYAFIIVAWNKNLQNQDIRFLIQSEYM
jgi:hypothetical protein